MLGCACRRILPVPPFCPRAGLWLVEQWQAGVISALQERYDLSSVDFVGASAGSLAATLAACEADMDLAMTLALELCDANEVRDSRTQQNPVRHYCCTTCSSIAPLSRDLR